MDFTAQLTRLAKIKDAATPVVSVYLNTRWADEHQRDRIRVFLKNELRKARRHQEGEGIATDLDWIEAQGEALIEQAEFPDAPGVALFACHGLGLREIVPVRVPFEDTFLVAETPFLRPLASLLEETPSALVVFVDGESARLIPLDRQGAGDEVRLESEVPGHHRRGGWAQLAQSRYQRHIQAHRGRHFEAVVEALDELVGRNGLERIVLAGAPRTISVFRKHLPRRLADRMGGIISGDRHESTAALVQRAGEFLSNPEHREGEALVDAVLTEAAKSGQAVAGVSETLEAVARGAVHRLYLLKGFREAGRVCVACGALQSGDSPLCHLCGQATRATELGETMVERVIATGGNVETIDVHHGLARVGGVAALLRYPL